MEDSLQIKNGISIPKNELEISASRAGGPGGQHVNKASTKITVKWNVKETGVLDEVLKERVLQNLSSRLTKEGYLVIHNRESRSQQKNKENALVQLAKIVRRALYVPKKRIATRVPKKSKEARLKEKAHRSKIKKMRKVRKFDD